MTLEQAVKTTLWMGIALLLMLTIGCGNRGTNTVTEYVSCSVTETAIVCPDGTSTLLPTPVDGIDGIDGIDGVVPVIRTTTKVPKGKCVEVADGVYVENILSGIIFDVYSNDKCSDSLGEFCDNITPSFGSSGLLGPDKPGGGGICWADNLLISGKKIGKDLEITVLDFVE